MRASRLTFLGTGSSAGTPVLRCLIQKEINCRVCEEATKNPSSVFARGPPCLLIEKEGGVLLIDCGQGFKPSAARLFPKLEVSKIDGVILTHDHLDAIIGLDHLREVQVASCPPGTWDITTRMPIYSTQRTLDTCKRVFPYLFEGQFKTLTGKLETRAITPGVPFIPEGVDLEIKPFEVEHGVGYMSLGFLFGTKERCAYISDVSRIPESVIEMLKESNISLLVIDSIAESPRPSHFSISQAVETVKLLKPKKTYLVGMSCSIDHYETNTYLESLNLSIELAYDGLSIETLL